MNKVLRTAKVNQIDYYTLDLSGLGAQDALACIFELFGVRLSKDNIYVDEYEVERIQLQKLHEHLSSQDDLGGHAQDFELYLQQAEVDKDKLLRIIGELINKSDPDNPNIRISWFDKENSPKDLDYIKSIYSCSEVCLGETLASIPADGLTLEEAFDLYIVAMKWGEGDRFYRVDKEGDAFEYKSQEESTESESPSVEKCCCENDASLSAQSRASNDTSSALLIDVDLMEEIEIWWRHDTSNDDLEVITGFKEGVYSDNSAFLKACHDFWENKTFEEKIYYWKSITQRSENSKLSPTVTD